MMKEYSKAPLILIIDDEEALRDGCKQVLEKSGLEIKEVKVNSFFSKKPVLNKLTQKLAQVWPSLFALTFVVKAKYVKSRRL